MLCYGFGRYGVATGRPCFAGRLARWFVRRRSLALALLYSAGAIGGFVAAPLLNRSDRGDRNLAGGLVAHRGTVRDCRAASLWFSCASGRKMWVRSRTGSAQPRLTAAGARYASSVRRAPGMDFRRPRRNPTYWVLLDRFIGPSGGYTLFLAHGVVHLQDLGHSARVGAWAVSIMTVSAASSVN